MIRKTYCVTILATLFLLFSLNACQTGRPTFVGYTAVAENVIQLNDSMKQDGEWNTFDLQLKYQIEREGSTIQGSGTANLSNYYEVHTSRIQSLDLFLFFLDTEAKVIGSLDLAHALGPQLDQVLKFEGSTTIPAGTTAISFGYRGETTGGGGAGDRFERTLFSNMPQQSK